MACKFALRLIYDHGWAGLTFLFSSERERRAARSEPVEGKLVSFLTGSESDGTGVF
jgi:hypothetical protein